MRKTIKGLAAVLAVTALSAGTALAADKLVVKDTTGTTNVFTVDDAGLVIAKKFGLGVTTPETSFHAAETTTSATRGLTTAQHNNGAQAAYMLFRKSRGTTTSPSIVSQGDFVGTLDAQGYDGANYNNSASFGFVVDGPVVQGSTTLPVVDPTYPGRVPQAFYIMTGYKQGNPGRAERFRIASDGRLRLSNQPAAPANNSACTVGDMILDAPNGYLYLCTATNTWKRATFASY